MFKELLLSAFCLFAGGCSSYSPVITTPVIGSPRFLDSGGIPMSVTMNHCSLEGSVPDSIPADYSSVVLNFTADLGYGFIEGLDEPPYTSSITTSGLVQDNFELLDYCGFGMYRTMSVTVSFDDDGDYDSTSIVVTAYSMGGDFVSGDYTFSDSFRPSSWYVQGGGTYGAMYFDGWLLGGVPSPMGTLSLPYGLLTNFEFMTPDGLWWNQIDFSTSGTGPQDYSNIKYGLSSQSLSDYVIAPVNGMYFEHMGFSYYEDGVKIRSIVVAETVWTELNGVSYITLDWRWLVGSYRYINFVARSISQKVAPTLPGFTTLDIAGLFISYSPVTENWVGSAYDPFQLLRGGFAVWSRLFSATIVPGITLGVMFTLPLVVALIVLVFKVIHR